MSYKGMHNPAHPGQVLREGWLDGLGLSITAAANILGLSRKQLSNIVNGHAPVTAETALRVELAFDSDAGLWLRMQAQYDAWAIEARRRELSRQVHRYEAAPA
ncbi:MAG: HigA family addiction module antitoxin [Pseudomonadota bacterium]